MTDTPATTATYNGSFSGDSKASIDGSKTPDEKTEIQEQQKEEWSYQQWLRNRREHEKSKQRLALTWNHLEVIGIDSKAAWMDDVFSYINPVEYIRRWSRANSSMTILHDFSGQVKPGEMLLVLGRPGSGCTSFLRSVANKRGEFLSVNGEVFYGSMDHVEAQKYRGTILYNSEEDIHSPTMTVAQTLGTVVGTRVTRRHREVGETREYIDDALSVVPKALGISHTRDTLVGNEFVRGVSGGERKRVSLGEVMAAQGAIMCWDNATRGLDASTALEFNQTLRHLADEAQATILTTLYQAGNGIFDVYDKVLVLDEGYRTYYGPRALARKYFEDLGFMCPPGANIADFLTSVTVPTERKIKPGFEGSVPTTAQQLSDLYLQSPISKMMESEVLPISAFAEDTAMVKTIYRDEQPKHSTPLQSSYKVGLYHQTIACVIRQFQIYMGDIQSLIMQQVSALIFSLIAGSLYYNLPQTSAGTFTRSGALYFPIVIFNITAMSEVVASFMGRPILARHRDFSLYRPTAYVIARMITDIPLTLLQSTIFSLIYYFMCGFQIGAGKFFTFWLFCSIGGLVMTQMYRFIGSAFVSFDNAAKLSGFWTTVFNVYGGYFIPFQTMHPWFKWLFWLSPAAYEYEGLMVNEFGGLVLECVGQQLVPNGPDYTNTINRACTMAGATADGRHIIGEDYLYQSFDYHVSHLWRNFGILVAWWFFYAVVTALALERSHDNSAKSSLLYKRGGAYKNLVGKGLDEEKGSSAAPGASVDSDSMTDLKIARNEAIFTWENLQYTVSVPGGQRKLLDGVTGWVKPGTLGALMGSSGAGKTTLLDVLAQRKDAGVIEGLIQVDGRPLPVSFQRSAGYCEQMDVHENTATVREALILSARLRQSSETPDAEKIAYVDSIINLLELEEIEDAIIGSPGAGLTVEQRKRLTIGVELAAKPSILLFLDEPTSGLDGQSAYNVVRFLRRLTAAGQAVLCTIHQPSASLFEAFDSLLLLAKGGKMVYFGETGTNSKILLDYFSRNGAPCPPGANPAEHIIDVVSGASGGGRDWNSVWNASPERECSLQELARLKEDALSRPSTVGDDGRDFATPLWTQLRLVTHRQQIALWRNPDYVWNKVFLHVSTGLFCGFTFWMLGDRVQDLQLRVLAVFNFLFVALGAIAQLQPLFIHNRNIFEAREKKAKMYSWLAFVTAQLIAEIPYLIACGLLYFATWYFSNGLPAVASTSGQVFLIMVLYEFLYTAIGQAIAAISPNESFAALVNPVILGACFISFSGVLVPYSQIVVFWRYWMYYLDPFNYLIGGLATQLLFDVKVTCSKSELTTFAPPSGQTCGEYMAEFFETGYGYLVSNASTAVCEYCEYSSGTEYARTLNLKERYYGWRDTGIVALFCVSTYGLVFLMMKLRSKKSKTAQE
ncbi:hypothetical protein BP5796_12273 [Coleophoma crateriformis]|uniref:ABC transporter domain-containing protein n=1 Tax=Coleophoma crateriformis TaxID=565419 RepID=A0A3D8Q927_9HELO|nr:hypothetical protein BP5796_12273 [Coleophoma crateriformis]